MMLSSLHVFEDDTVQYYSVAQNTVIYNSQLIIQIVRFINVQRVSCMWSCVVLCKVCKDLIAG